MTGWKECGVRHQTGRTIPTHRPGRTDRHTSSNYTCIGDNRSEHGSAPSPALAQDCRFSLQM